MTDISTITTIATSVKTAIDIAKAIKDADVSLEKADYKYRIAELIEALADAKIAAAETIDVLEQKDRQIAELEALLRFKETLIRYRDAYFEAVDGAPSGDPYCAHCWEVEHVAVHLKTCVQNARNMECPKCKAQHMSHHVKLG